MVDKFSLSIPEGYLEKIDEFIENNQRLKLKSRAAGFQYILEYFFKKTRIEFIKTFLLLVGYPMIIMVIMLYITQNTQSINAQLLSIPLVTDLLLHQQIYAVISFAFLGIMIAGFAFLVWVRGKK